MSPEFGEWVLAVREERGMSQRAASYKTGIDRFTLADMEKGVVVRLELVEQFARGFGLDVNDARARAGFQPVETGRQILKEGLYDLSQRAGHLVGYNGSIPEDELSPEAARQYVADTEVQMRERGLLKD